jgi:NAD(P)-dependent dehydrogenase (short-subunit alcohol dehydrogenase family)
LVTGGSRGLGRAISKTLAAAGADVAICYSKDESGAAETLKALEVLGRRAMAARADVRNAGEVEALVGSVSEAFGGIDLLVSNAGVPSPGKPVAETEPEEFRRVLETHLMGAFHCARAAIPIMRTNTRSDLIFISSEVTRKTPPGRGPYTAGKAAIEAMARTIANEERANGIRANCIAPGVIDTGYALTAARRRGFATVEEMNRTLPFGRMASAKEIGELCVFLASESGSYINGEVIIVNGGP